MPVLQLNPPIPVITPLGSAQAHFIWTEGIEQEVIYGCFQQETGENWWFPNHQIRLCPNITQGHPTCSEIKTMKGLEKYMNDELSRPREAKKDNA